MRFAGETVNHCHQIEKNEISRRYSRDNRDKINNLYEEDCGSKNNNASLSDSSEVDCASVNEDCKSGKRRTVCPKMLELCIEILTKSLKDLGCVPVAGLCDPDEKPVDGLCGHEMGLCDPGEEPEDVLCGHEMGLGDPGEKSKICLRGKEIVLKQKSNKNVDEEGITPNSNKLGTNVETDECQEFHVNTVNDTIPLRLKVQLRNDKQPKYCIKDAQSSKMKVKGEAKSLIKTGNHISLSPTLAAEDNTQLFGQRSLGTNLVKYAKIVIDVEEETREKEYKDEKPKQEKRETRKIPKTGIG